MPELPDSMHNSQLQTDKCASVCALVNVCVCVFRGGEKEEGITLDESKMF